MSFNFFKQVEIDYKQGSHWKSLDGLRGIAILLVVLYHCFPVLYKLGTGIGWVGVDLFFVLSGFLITGILLDSKNKPHYFLNFIRNRALRIFPLYYFFLFIFFFALPFFLSKNWTNDYAFYYDNQWWYWLYIPNWLIVFSSDWPPVSKPILDHFWSLAIEEQFYLVWPLLVYFFSPKKLLNFCLLLFISSFLVRNWMVINNWHYSASYVFTFARLDTLAIGAFLAISVRNQALLRKVNNWVPYTLLLSIFVLFSCIVMSKSVSLKTPLIIQFGYTSIAVLFGSLMVYALSSKSKVFMVCNNSILRWIGKYSYGIYLFHWFLYPLFAGDVHEFISQYIQQHIVADFITSTVLVSATLLLAVISYHGFEKWFLGFKHKNV